jgi:hypothetical protein
MMRHSGEASEQITGKKKTSEKRCRNKPHLQKHPVRLNRRIYILLVKRSKAVLGPFCCSLPCSQKKAPHGAPCQAWGAEDV